MKRFNILVLAMLAGMLSACGGGDEGYGGKTPDGGDSDLAISMSLLDQTTELPTTSISSTAPGILQATVTYNGAPLASELVTFGTNLGDMDPESGTALTDANGVASIVLNAGPVGAGTATGEVNIGEETATGSLNFRVTNSFTTATLDMGYGTGNAFEPDVVDLGGITILSAGGTLTASVNIVETSNANAAYTPSVDVQFESSCTKAGTSSMDSPVPTANGAASSTYKANGCIGIDVITARVSIDGTTYTAQASVEVLSPTVGHIRFDSASHEVIAIQGTGSSNLSETSTVTFTVLDSAKNPVPNQAVDFALSTTVGGITLDPSSATTNADGQVQTVVHSGTVNTSVQVIATVTGTTKTTGSVALAISTGLPDQNSFSIAMETLNPKAWELNGVTVPVTIFVADHFNNPAPDGTAIAFQTEGGFIGGSCIITDGQCTVNWVSTDPRPADGRVTILATAIGEEGFTDTNSNGRFDDGEPFTDLPEAYRDDDESNSFDDGQEEFLDFDVDGGYDAPNGLYNGTLCGAQATLCDPSGDLVHTRSSGVLVMASRVQTIRVFDTKGTPDDPNDDKDVTSDGLVVKDNGDITQIRVDVQDARGQVPPSGTTVEIDSQNPISKILGGTGAGKGNVPNTSSPGPFSVFASLQAKTLGSGSDVITVSVGVPGEDKVPSSIPILLKDVTGPTTTNVTPAFGATGVARDATISVTFSEAMDAASVTAGITIAPDLTGTWLYDPSTLKATFLASGLMAASTTYTVTVGTSVLDSKNNPLNSVDGTGAAPQKWAFRTGL